MSYDADSSGFERISTRKLAIMFGLMFAAAIFFIQFIQGFPIKDLFQSAKSEVVVVSSKSDQTCLVTPSDERPRQIQGCTYSVGDNVTITYNPSSAAIISHKLAPK
ncbi:MAG: hypothetical protein ABI361_01300 [Nitrososphaera sp.]|jgi:hypothetical protein